MGSVAEIRIARRTGFCYGVREAIDKAKEAAAAGKATHTLGQVVHNEGVVRDLQAIVVDEEEDWERIPRRKKMALISQSTQPPWKFEKLAAYMVSRSHELKIVNTVCPVTIRRQEDTLEAAREVDLMVVVGGRSSANTKELTRLCGIAGTEAIQIESVRDLDDAGVFKGARVVGVTGGTSTPIEDLHAVAQRILELGGTPKARANAAGLADAAFALAATPAGRTTSLPSRDATSLPAAS